MKKPLLIDVDGVLRLGNKPAPGLNEFLEFIKSKNIPAVAISNSTLKSAKGIVEFFTNKNYPLPFQVFTAADLTYKYVKENYSTASVYGTPEIMELFGDIPKSTTPEAVVVGDLGKSWTFDILNEIFNKVLAGSKLIAMQKNKFWKTPEDGYLLDLGAFIAALEYATDTTAMVMGKPSANFFNMALESVNSPNNGFIMLGDDIVNDIGGAQNIGGLGVLVLTGKTDSAILEASEIKPDYCVKDLKEFINLAKEFYL